MKNIAEVTDIYNKYAYLLGEKEKVKNWIEKEHHTREEYNKLLKKYALLYDEVN